MQRRAENVDRTRQRITEATVRLHTTVGPAATSIAAIADEAGVTRVTVYRHFADLDELFAACTAHWYAAHPPPDPGTWASRPTLPERARAAFGALYGWYRANAGDLAPIHRDLDHWPSAARAATEAELVTLAASIVGDTDPADQANPDPAGARRVHVLARHFVDFRTWQSLATAVAGHDTELDTELDDDQLAELATAALLGAADLSPADRARARRR